jgi:hypothetical protein
MDLVGLKASTDAVLAQLPGLEGFVEGVRVKLTASVKEVVDDGLKAMADGIGQIVGLGQSIDGLTVDFEVEPISIPAIKAKMVVSMPLKFTPQPPEAQL